MALNFAASGKLDDAKCSGCGWPRYCCLCHVGPERIQRKRTKGWRMPSETVYVGRPTKWGNPYKPGDLLWDVPARIVIKAGYGHCCESTMITPEMAVELYRVHAEQSDLDFTELAGLDVACWCGEDDPCHGDVVLELANGDKNE